MSQTRSTRFRELLKKPPFVCMGAHDAVTAKLAEAAGAPAIYVSGFVASATSNTGERFEPIAGTWTALPTAGAPSNREAHSAVWTGDAPSTWDTLRGTLPMLLGMGLVFQMPAVVYFLARLRIVSAGFLVRHFKYAVLIIFIAAAVITPSGDMMTQTIFAAPMLGLYLLSIVIAWIVGPKRLRAAE